MTRSGKTGLYHVELRVSNFRKSFQFYDSLFRRLGWKQLDRGADYCGWEDATPYSGNLWIIQAEHPYRAARFHRKRPGLNHIAFMVAGREEVDHLYREFLLKKRIPVLYGGPKEYPEYHRGYYAVYFEDPDRMKLEVTHIPRQRRKTSGII